MLFKRLFSSYYFMFLRLRRINRTRIETFQAMCMICVIQFLWIVLIAAYFKKIFQIDIPPIPKIYPILLCLIWIGLGYIFFLSDRNRTREIIESYRNLTSKQKNLWTFAAIVAVIVPMVLLPIIA